MLKRKGKNKQTKKNDHKNSKGISGTFSGGVVCSVRSVHFRIVPWSGLYFSRSKDPSYVVGTNDRVLIYCTCHFQGRSLCFSFFCLLVSSVSVFHPDTRGAVVDTFFKAHLFSRTVGREGCCNQITLACARSVSATLGLPLLTAHVPSLPTQLSL